MPALIACIIGIVCLLLLFVKLAAVTVPLFVVIAAVAVYGANVKVKGRG
jgi:hypothetical protein